MRGVPLKSSQTKIDGVDIQIIKALEENSRLSMRKLARKVGLTAIVVRKRVENLEKKGVVVGYIPLVDPVKLGYNVTAIVMIQIEGGHISDVESEVAMDSNVLSVYNITGDFDAVLLTKFKDNASLNVFLKNLLTMRFIKRTVTMVALNVIKESCNIL